MSRPVLTLALLALILAGCSGSHGGAGATGTTEPTPEATATPEPTAVLGAGTINTTFDARCDLTQYGAEITVTYQARATGALLVNRVRLRVDGLIVADTGEIFQLEFAGMARVRALAGVSHVYQVITVANGRPPLLARNSVRCPNRPPDSQI